MQAEAKLVIFRVLKFHKVMYVH